MFVFWGLLKYLNIRIYGVYCGLLEKKKIRKRGDRIFKITIMDVKCIKFTSNIIRRVSTKPTTNGEISPYMYNRNPRNLERMRIERKPTGYALETNKLSFWHKLQITNTSKYIVAQLVHNTEKVVVQASTNEWALHKFLYSKNDSMAYLTLGQVFAERCMESGIISFACPYKINHKEKPKLSLFLDTLKNEGLILKEADVFDVHDIWHKKRQKRPWTVLED